MSDLREALEAIGVAWDDGNAVGLDGYVGPNRGAGDVDPEAERRRGQLLDRAAEMLAAQVDPETGFARPLLDREAAIKHLGGSELATATVDHLLSSDLVRPMPTHKQIVGSISTLRIGHSGQLSWSRTADAVLALLNGTDQTTEE